MTEKPPSAAPFADAANTTLSFLLEEANRRLETQVQLELAADTRSTAVLAASIALAGAGLAVLGDTYENAPDLAWAAAAFAAVSMSASTVAVTALWPSPIQAPGARPGIFVEDVKAAKPHQDILAEYLALLDARLLSNRTAAKRNRARIRIALIVLSQAPIAATIALVWRILRN